jgi:hypothetical protein
LRSCEEGRKLLRSNCRVAKKGESYLEVIAELRKEGRKPLGRSRRDVEKRGRNWKRILKMKRREKEIRK